MSKSEEPARIGLGRRIAGAVVAGVSVLALVLFVIARVWTDRWLWSQMLWWVPVLWWVLGLWLGAGLTRLAMGRGRRAVRVVVGAALGVTLFVVVGVWHAPRAVLGGAQGQRDWRVVHWNIGGERIDLDRATRVLQALDPDLILIANARWDGDRSALIGALAHEGSGLSVRSIGQAIVITKHDISRIGSSWFSGHDEDQTQTRRTGRSGWVCALELTDARRADPVVVWFVDLPSEPTAWRVETMERAVVVGLEAGASGRVRRPSGGWGSWGVASDEDPMDAPDLIVGDFNTPRGSGSLDRFDDELNRSYTSAFHSAGWGRARSWIPDSSSALVRAGLSISDWHIDLTLVESGHRAVGWSLVGLSETAHRAQVVDVDLE